MSTESNPFKFGSIVRGDDFIDRDKERSDLKNHIKNHTNIILHAPRRYGKTSLIYKTLTELEQEDSGFIGIVVDFYAVHSRQKFQELLANQIFKKSGWSFERVLDWLKQSIRGVQPALTSDDSGAPRLELRFNHQQQDSTFEDVLNLPYKLSQQGKLVCVVFDEFQEITQLNGQSFQKELRSQIQHHDDVSYIFCGSKQHLITELFNQSSAPLYNFGKFWSLGKIPKPDFVAFLSEQIRRVRPGFSDADAESLYEMGEGIPFYVQLIGYEYFNLCHSESTLGHMELLEKVHAHLLENQSAEFLATWDRMNTSQKQALDMVLKTNGAMLFSKNNLGQFNMAASTLKKALSQLQDNGVLEFSANHYSFQNIFFRHWLKMMM